LIQGNAVTDFLVLAAGAAFCAVAFVVFARQAMEFADPRNVIIARGTRHIYRSPGVRVASTLFASVVAAGGLFVTYRFATDPHYMPDANRALFWMALGLQVAWLVRAVYHRYGRSR
jgi:hypothetical protein